MEYLHSIQNSLMLAISRQDWPAVRISCETEQHLINTYNEDGDTPLMHAVVCNAPEDVLLLLIENSAAENIEYENEFDSQTILHILARCAYVSAMRRALETTITKINQRYLYGRTLLHECLSASHSYDAHQETALCLLKYGASISIKDDMGNTPLDLYDANECSKYEEITRDKKKNKLIELLEEQSVPAEILARGDDAVKAFKDEIQDGEITVVNSKIMFLGNEGTGKTSCVNAMLGKAFNDQEPSTDGIVTTTVVQTVGEDCSKWEEQDVDVCERTKQIREHGIAANVAKRLIVPKLASSSASLSASLSASDPGRTSPSGSTASSMENVEEPTNMMTLDERDNRLEKKLPDGIHKKLVDKLADQNPGPISVSPNDVTCIWDYAGQLTYYITHRFFLTDGSSYGVVFSLLDQLDAKAKPRDYHKGQFEMTNLQIILFWIRSIFEHAVLPHGAKKRTLINGTIASPPISLIGTHMDQLPGSDADKQISIKDIFNRIFEEIKGTPYERHVDREMYAVDNTSACDKGIEKLKKNVGGYTKAMARTVPIKWVDFQTKVQEVGKTTVRMSLNEITRISVECGISKENVIHVLTYLNDIGIILYSSTNKKLRNTVITNIHMLIGIFMKIITAVKPDDHDKGVPVMMQYWRKLDEEGILEEELLRFLWRNEIPAGKDCDVIFEDFLELMKTFGLLFEKGSQEGSRVFIVPSRMNLKTGNLEVKEDKEQMVSIYVTPRDFLPDAVYNVLVVKFLDLSQDKACIGDPKLFQNQAEIGFDNLHYLRLGVVCINNKRSLKMEITRRTEMNENGKTKPASKPQAIACMEGIFRRTMPKVKAKRRSARAAVPEEQPAQEASIDYAKLAAEVAKHLNNQDAASQSQNSAPVQSQAEQPDHQPPLLESVAPLLTHMLQGEQQNETLSLTMMDSIALGSDVPAPVKTKIWNNQYIELRSLLPDQRDNNLSILHVLKLHLDELYPSKSGVSYTLNILCPVCSVGSNQGKHHFQSLDDCLKNDSIPCGTSAMSTAKIRSLFQADLSFSKEIRNFYALQSLTNDMGIEQMRKYFMNEGQLRCKHDVGNFLLLQRQNGVLKDGDLGDQATEIFKTDVDIDTFDITMLMFLIEHCFSPKGTPWQNPPDDKDTSKLANLRRIQLYKETIIDCSHSNRVTDVEFYKQWMKLRTIFEGVGVPVEDIQKYHEQYIEGSVRGFDKTDIEEINFQAISSVIVGLGTETMREYFLEVTKLDKKEVGKYLMNEKSKGSFKHVKITKQQKPKMFTPTADIRTFDISIMYLIIRNCCSLPVSFWNDPDRLPSLVHIHNYRNSKLAHAPVSRMSTKDFEIEWKKVRSMLRAAGASFKDIDKYKALRFIN